MLHDLNNTKNIAYIIITDPNTEVMCIFYIFHSAHYNSFTLIQTNKCKQLCYSFNNIIRPTNYYMFRALLAHHQQLYIRSANG
jgi:hypothetical protein